MACNSSCHYINIHVFSYIHLLQTFLLYQTLLNPLAMILQVCGVQPGRVLELRTTLGLMRARAMLEQQIEQERQMMDEGLKDGDKKGQLLKHGKYVKCKLNTFKAHLYSNYSDRLKPLGVVADPSMRSNSCLGIVSGE